VLRFVQETVRDILSDPLLSRMLEDVATVLKVAGALGWYVVLAHLWHVYGR
jgi:hypothetical protein